MSEGFLDGRENIIEWTHILWMFRLYSCPAVWEGGSVSRSDLSWNIHVILMQLRHLQEKGSK